MRHGAPGVSSCSQVHDVGVGIEVITQSHDRNRCAALLALLYDLGLHLWAVKTSSEAIGVSLARHGVHDLHRAHFELNSALLQDVLPGRVPPFVVRAKENIRKKLVQSDSCRSEHFSRTLI